MSLPILAKSRGGAFAAGPAAPAAGAGFSNTKSVQFDGVDETISCGDMADLNGIAAITLSMWVYMNEDGNMTWSTNTNLTAGMFMQTHSDDLYYGVGGGGYMRCADTRPSLSAWHHICGVYDVAGGGLNKGAIYVDGSAVTVTLANWGNTSGAAAGDSINIGRYNNGTSYWDGKLDEIAIWDSALSAAQVTNIYKGEENGGSGGTNGTTGDLASFSPLGWWRMGDGDSFPTLTNHGSTGATNNGTMVNMESGDIVEDVP